MWFPGMSPSPTQTMPCCMANSERACRVDSLSPLSPPELVKPAASLSFQRCSSQRGEVASRKALNGADGPAM